MRKFFLRVAVEYCKRFSKSPKESPLKVYKRSLHLFIGSIATLAVLAVLFVIFETKLLLYANSNLSLQVPQELKLITYVGVGATAASLLILSFTPYIKLKSHFDDLEKEGFWYAYLTKFFTLSGVQPLNIFEELLKVELPATKREVSAFMRDALARGGDKIDALLTYIHRLPRGAWYNLLKFVESTTLLGQSVEVAVNNFTRSVETEFKTYLERKCTDLSTFATAVITVFTLLPLMLFVIVAILASGVAITIMMSFLIVEAILAPILIAVSTGLVFKEGPLYMRRYLRSLPFISIPIVALIATEMELVPQLIPHMNFILLTSSIVVTLFLAYKEASEQVRIVDDVIFYSPTFISDLIVELEQGKDFGTAARDLLNTVSYSSRFDDLMSIILVRGTTHERGFEGAFEEMRDRLPRTVLLALYMCFKAASTGFVKGALTIADALREYRDLIKSVKARLGIIKVLLLISCILSMALVMYMMKTIMPQMAQMGTQIEQYQKVQAFGGGMAIPFDFMTLEELPAFQESLLMAIFLSNVLAALTIGTITDMRLYGGIKMALYISLITLVPSALFLLGVI